MGWKELMWWSCTCRYIMPAWCTVQCMRIHCTKFESELRGGNSLGIKRCGSSFHQLPFLDLRYSEWDPPCSPECLPAPCPPLGSSKVWLLACVSDVEDYPSSPDPTISLNFGVHCHSGHSTWNKHHSVIVWPWRVPVQLWSLEAWLVEVKVQVRLVLLRRYEVAEVSLCLSQLF